MKQSYSRVGVDVGVEAKAAKILYRAAKETWKNRQGKLGEVMVPDDSFSGLRYIDIAGLPKGTVVYGGSDGIATKSELAERAQRFDTVAFDLMAMVCDDAVIRGAEPVMVKTVLAVNTLGQNDDRLHYIEELAKGYVAAAKVAGVAVINGEIAQHNNRMGSQRKFSFEWDGDVTWFAHKSRLLSGFEVKPGDFLVGLYEPGLRCNGTSLVRDILKKQHGKNWETVKLGDDLLIDLALWPSRIYAKAVVEMFGGWSLEQKPKAVLHGAAHISGGGIPEKLGRALKPSGLGAVIDNLFEPSKLLSYCQEIGKVSDEEAYRSWNMGQGMILITPDFQNVIKIAKKHGIEARVIGRVSQEPGIVIQSRGLNGGELRFLP